MQNEAFFRMVQSDLKNLFAITRYLRFSTRYSEIWNAIFHFPHDKNWNYLAIPKRFFKSDCAIRKITTFCVCNRFFAIFESLFAVDLAICKNTIPECIFLCFFFRCWFFKTPKKVRKMIEAHKLPSGIERDTFRLFESEIKVELLQSIESYSKFQFQVLFFPPRYSFRNRLFSCATGFFEVTVFVTGFFFLLQQIKFRNQPTSCDSA